MAKEIKPMNPAEKKEHEQKLKTIEAEIRSTGTNLVGANVLARHFGHLTNHQRKHISHEIRNGKTLTELIDNLA